MKRSLKFLLATTILSLAIWMFFFVTLNEELTGEETIIVVGVSGAIIFLVRRLWSAITKDRRKEVDE